MWNWKSKRVLAFSIVAIAAGLCAELLVTGTVQLLSPSHSEYPVRGIDVFVGTRPEFDELRQRELL